MRTADLVIFAGTIRVSKIQCRVSRQSDDEVNLSRPKKLSVIHNDAHDHDHDHGTGQTMPTDEAQLIAMLRLVQENQDLKTNYERLLAQSGRALMKTLELRDAYTYGHSMRVMEYTMLIGRGAGLSIQDLKTLELSAMFHDVGKVGVPDCVLLKPSRLSPEEQKVMAEHARNSAEIMELIDEFRIAAPGARHHHERFDGAGYPSGLKGKDIPLQSRIILVADTFDAMTSNRPYRNALAIETAYAELTKFSGVQFDPEFVKVFLREHKKMTATGQNTTAKIALSKIKKAA